MITGCDSIARKKIELYRDQYPDVQLFFRNNEPGPHDLIVMPAEQLPEYFKGSGNNRLLSSPLIAFGPEVAMPAAISAGCDDYLCEPWGPVEFYERARQCIQNSIVEAGGMFLNLRHNRRLQLLDGESIVADVLLSSAGHQLFRLFSRNRGSFFSREYLSAVFCSGERKDSRAADMHVARLRKSINGLLCSAGGSEDDNPVVTLTGRGWGIF